MDAEAQQTLFLAECRIKYHKTNFPFISWKHQKSNDRFKITEIDHHINDAAFAEIAARLMDQMIRES